MKLKARIQLVLIPRSSWCHVLGLILPVDKNTKTTTKTLTMANMPVSIKTSIKLFRHVTNTSMITNMPLNYANDARIFVTNLKKQANCVGFRG